MAAILRYDELHIGNHNEYTLAKKNGRSRFHNNELMLLIPEIDCLAQKLFAPKKSNGGIVDDPKMNSLIF